MRVTSDLWVSALVRRVFGAGGFAAVMRRGAAEAGAIFVIARERTGEVTLFGPAPQTDYEEGRPDERRFQELTRTAEEQLVTTRLEKEMRFDPDVWIVEMELSGQQAEELFPVMKPSE
jgi:hypothetical protein